MSRDIKTKADYDEFVAAFKAFMKREQLDGFTCGSVEHDYEGECKSEDHLHDSNGDYECEPHFSWRACECCGGTLGGNRHDVIAATRESDERFTRSVIRQFTVCEDCVYFAEYGRLDDSKMLELGIT